MACFSLIGFPFLSGFYSKDLVLEAFLSGGLNIVLCLMVIFSTCLTSIYRGWLIYGVFFSPSSFGSGFRIVSNRFLSIPCRFLGVGALFGGILIQSVVLDFNIFFEVLGVLKIVPIGCLFSGILGLIIYLTYLGIKVYDSVAIDSGVKAINIVEDRMLKI